MQCCYDGAVRRGFCTKSILNYCRSTWNGILGNGNPSGFWRTNGYCETVLSCDSLRRVKWEKRNNKKKKRKKKKAQRSGCYSFLLIMRRNCARGKHLFTQQNNTRLIQQISHFSPYFLYIPETLDIGVKYKQNKNSKIFFR